VIVFRHADPRLPFLVEGRHRSSARWHEAGDPSTHYFADTPDSAWAEFLRHEEIADPADLAHVRRAIWAVEIPDDEPAAAPALAGETVTGGPETYPECRAEAKRLRDRGATRLDVTSAALLPGAARGFLTSGGLQPARPRDGRTIVLFGSRPTLVAWRAVHEGRPAAELMERVRRF
jgi:hypothetical protein